MQINAQLVEWNLPPRGAPVLVAGGVAVFRDGQWFSGMEEPLYQRPLEWTPKWWASLPIDNEWRPE